ncbi:MAG: hypothetical protein ACT4P7_17060 [Gemmatimonadaceae bacterium]
MPASYHIDPSLGLVYSRGWGTLVPGELFAHARALGTDPRFDPLFSQLADFHDVARFSVSSADVRKLTMLNPFRAGARRAIVASADWVFGMARMYELTLGQPDGDVHVFRDPARAVRWLGLSEDWVLPPPDRFDALFDMSDTAPPPTDD